MFCAESNKGKLSENYIFILKFLQKLIKTQKSGEMPSGRLDSLLLKGGTGTSLGVDGIEIIFAKI